jgi:hypothetical protein
MRNTIHNAVIDGTGFAVKIAKKARVCIGIGTEALQASVTDWADQ